MASRKTLNVGIDLGTSRTVIACDNGIRTFVPSYVGYAKDAVTEKMLGKKIVFGDDALKYKMGLELYKPIENGVIKFSDDPDAHNTGYKKSLEVSRELLKHVISLVIKDEPKDNLIIRGVVGAPALASLNNKKAILDITKGILDGVMVVSEPFTVAYNLGCLYNYLIIDIGAGTVDLCRMHGTIPSEEDQITSLMAGDHIDRTLLKLVHKRYPEANLTVNMIKRFKEENAFISSQGEKVTIEIPVNGKPTTYDVTDELRLACKEIVPDIVEGIKKLVATSDPEFQNELKGNIVLAGGGSQISGLKKEIENYMQKTLGYGRVTKIEEPLFAGANGALMLARDMPDEYWDEITEE
ncbi:MAG: rod shape-determining protein [Desulfamplus sp.]|nr:rod shape-determining protein [Desulfamplus sp.]MBF0240881.1 rod shape-determining protein [Desulfamplus sp.]MBF0388976.1 rod shape-determining protein [Desulfamplus sp.]